MSLLASCGAKGPAIVRTETVEVKVASYVALDPELTKQRPEPAAPPAKCRDQRGKRTVCNKDALNYIDALRAWGRGAYAQIQSIFDLQPKPAP